MSDLISRQAAIDAVCMEWCGVKHQDCKHPFDDENDDYYWCDGCETVLRTLPDLPPAQPEQRWIPWSSGKLPEESGTYTVTAYDGVTKRVTYAKYQKRLKRWELTGARAYWRVLAWMPLPEPYKGVTE